MKKKRIRLVIIILVLGIVGFVGYKILEKRVMDRETFDLKTDVNGSNETVNNNEHSFLGKVLEASSSYLIVEPNENEEERKSSDKFRIGLTESNLNLKVGDYIKITYEGGINESYPAQVGTTKIEKIEISLFSNANFKVKMFDVSNTIKYYPYYKHMEKVNDENRKRIIYFAGDIEEFYIIGEKDMSLKEYITTTFQTFDDSIESILEKMKEVDTLKDGGTKIYKSEELDLTITICNTLDKNQDIYFNHYRSDFDETMCK